MCSRCKELLTENARLRDLLEVRTRADLVGRVRAYLHVTEGQARMLLRMYRDRGAVVSFADLLGAIPIRYRRNLKDERSAGLVRSFIMQARESLPPGCIESVRAYGYRLTPFGCETIGKALSGDMLRAA